MKLTLARIVLAWLLGLVAATWLTLPLPLLIAFSLLMLVVVCLYYGDESVRRIALLSMCCLLGMWRVELSAPFPHDGVSRYNDQGALLLRGTISSDPEIRDQHSRFRVQVESVRYQGRQVEAEGVVLVYASRYPYHMYGDRIALNGSLQTPRSAPDFDYAAYLARRGIYSVMYYPDIALVEASPSQSLRRVLYAQRRRGRQVIAHILPEPQASLLMGILLGWESDIAPALMDAFAATGTIHLLVISGFNLTILAGMLARGGAGWIHRYSAHLLALALIVLYTLFVGAETPVVRAAWMVAMSLCAYLVGRPYHVADGLALAVGVMTIGHPHLLWDASFQLSVMAVLGLFLLLPRLQEQVQHWLARDSEAEQRLRWGRLLEQLILATLACQITTLPLIMYHFGELAWVGLFANVLVLPVQPMIMVSGGIATLAGALWLPLGQVLGWVPWLLLAFTTAIVNWTAAWPGAVQSFQIPAWALILYYAALFGAPWIWSRRQAVGGGLHKMAAFLTQPSQEPLRRGMRLGMLVLTAAVLLEWTAALTLPDGNLHIHILDIGQGDAILLQLPQGQQILVDGGPDPSVLLAELGAVMPFWDRTLDMVVLTHGDLDHLGGLIPVLERYQVECVLETGVMAETAPTRQWRSMLDNGDWQAHQARQGMIFHWGDPERLRLEVLHPSAPFLLMDVGENNQSIVLRLVYGEIKVLLTGDIEAEAEAELVHSGLLAPCQVLKVSHHGAGQASTAPFLRAVDPHLALISVGSDNPHGHPAKATLQRLTESDAQVLRTDQVGTIEVITNGSALWLSFGRW